MVLIATAIAFGFTCSSNSALQSPEKGAQNFFKCTRDRFANWQSTIDRGGVAEGADMIVVVQDGNISSGNLVFVMFYSLKDGVWQRANAIQLGDVGSRDDVSLSGKTALVGCIAGYYCMIAVASHIAWITLPTRKKARLH